jgi:hypothetical protein
MFKLQNYLKFVETWCCRYVFKVFEEIKYLSSITPALCVVEIKLQIKNSLLYKILGIGVGLVVVVASRGIAFTQNFHEDPNIFL